MNGPVRVAILAAGATFVINYPTLLMVENSISSGLNTVSHISPALNFLPDALLVGGQAIATFVIALVIANVRKNMDKPLFGALPGFITAAVTLFALAVVLAFGTPNPSGALVPFLIGAFVLMGPFVLGGAAVSGRLIQGVGTVDT